jgi:hypothetical protein
MSTRPSKILSNFVSARNRSDHGGVGRSCGDEPREQRKRCGEEEPSFHRRLRTIREEPRGAGAGCAPNCAPTPTETDGNGLPGGATRRGPGRQTGCLSAQRPSRPSGRLGSIPGASTTGPRFFRGRVVLRGRVLRRLCSSDPTSPMTSRRRDSLPSRFRSLVSRVIAR